MSDPRGEWIRKPQEDAAVIFVHGIFSSGDECWRSGEVYWPALFTREEQARPQSFGLLRQSQ